MTQPISPATIAKIAEEQFRRRRNALQRAKDNGDWPGDPANEKARLWLAIAAAAGAKLPEMQVPTIFPLGDRTFITARDIADRDAYLAELARARDVAIRKAEANRDDLRADQNARDLIALADALGAPAFDHSTPAERNAA